MRVIAGEFRSRKLQSMPGDEVRPTPDKMRQTLFNILQLQIEDAVFVDAYAGTGAVGIEALSRGAKQVVFIEKSRDAAALIKSNLASLGIPPSRGRVIHAPVVSHIASLAADIIFIDPPYPKEQEYRAALEALEDKPPKLTVVQHSTRFHLKDKYGPLRRSRIVKQGDNALSFFTVSSDPVLSDLVASKADSETDQKAGAGPSAQ